MVFRVVLLSLLAVHAIEVASGLECYTCTNVTAIVDCQHTVSCPDGHVCSKHYISLNSNLHFTLGCIPEWTCPSSPLHPAGGDSSSILGRSVHARSAQQCSDCCRTNNCNRQLCQEAYPHCQDAASFNCSVLGASVNFCTDTVHTKSICRRFCGLCDTVDGGWASWGTWSACTFTCGNGTRARERACTDPEPADGGLPCSGLRQETVICNSNPCPVHGGWTQWSAWGSCSSSCDIGMQRRDRTCSNPYPMRNGDHCFGDARDDRLCLPGACADGGWSNWTAWSPCSSTCGNGLHTRSRTCDNPTPSIVGRYCSGNPSQTEACNVRPCPAAGWSVWGSWSACSSSCGDGIHMRARTCNNPAPSDNGSYCAGTPSQTEACNLRRCPQKLSAFSASSAVSSGSPLLFMEVIINVGHNFNVANGTFTCTVPGLYYFTADLTKARDNNKVDRVNAYIRKNGKHMLQIQTDPTDDDTDIGSYEATGSVVLQLVAGDTVYVHIDNGSVEPFSSFSGFLIAPDP